MSALPAELAGLALHATGSGRALLLIHSSGFAGLQWRRLVKGVGGARLTLPLDLPGCGNSAPWPTDEPHSLDAEAARLAAVVDALDGPVDVIAHSYGAALALRLGLQRPERIAQMALFEPVALGMLFTSGDAEGLADLGALDVQMGQHVPGTEGSIAAFIDYWSGPGAWLALRPEARAGLLATGPKVALETRALREDRRPASDYAPLGDRLLLLQGGETKPAARRVVALLSEAIPAARVKVLEGLGHLAPLTHAAQVDPLLLAHVGLG